MKDFLLVFLGGGLGSIARFVLAKLYSVWNPVFPLATLTANFLSCVIFGLVIMLGANRLNISPAIKLFMLTGFCGGFSTFSAFTFETAELFKTGNTLIVLSNILANLFLSIIGLYLGTTIARFF